MKSSTFSEFNRVMELQLPMLSVSAHNEGTSHLNSNTLYCLKCKVASEEAKETVFAAVATPRGLLRGPTAMASGNRVQRHGDMTYNTNTDGVNVYLFGLQDADKRLALRDTSL